MRIEVDDITRPEVLALLQEHMAHMHELNPPEEVFSLDANALRAPDVTFWTAWEDGALLGCGALKTLDARQAEVKSMRTPAAARRRGAGRAILEHIVQAARARGHETLLLETGSHPAYAPAVALYRSVGFEHCGPFADYEENANSVFMRLRV